MLLVSCIERVVSPCLPTHETHLGNFEIICWRALFLVPGHLVNFLLTFSRGPNLPKRPQTSPNIPKHPQTSPNIPKRPQRSPNIPKHPQTSPGEVFSGGYQCDVMNTNWGVESFANKTCRHQLSQFHRRSFRSNSPPRSARTIHFLHDVINDGL